MTLLDAARALASGVLVDATMAAWVAAAAAKHPGRAALWSALNGVVGLVGLSEAFRGVPEAALYVAGLAAGSYAVASPRISGWFKRPGA